MLCGHKNHLRKTSIYQTTLLFSWAVSTRLFHCCDRPIYSLQLSTIFPHFGWLWTRQVCSGGQHSLGAAILWSNTATQFVQTDKHPQMVMLVVSANRANPTAQASGPNWSKVLCSLIQCESTKVINWPAAGVSSVNLSERTVCVCIPLTCSRGHRPLLPSPRMH